MALIEPPQVGEVLQEESPGLVEPPTNKYIQEMIDQYNVTKQAYDQLLYQRAKESLFVFNRYVLDVEKGKEELAPFHKELCNFVQDNTKKKKLILIPRGHLKSTLITIGYCTQQIIKNPNIRILILNATWQMAVDFLTEIKRNLQTNQTILELFGDVTQNNTEWSQDRITLARTDHNIKGPTVWATGIDSNLVGSHPDLIILDDVVNRDNSQTLEQNEKVILRYKDCLDLLEPGGQLIAIGTRWSESDFYSWILDPENEVGKSYDKMIRRAYEGDLETGEGFNPLWPAKFSQKELLTRLREKGWYEFSSQYLNDPVPQQNADFKREWFQYYDLEDYRGTKMTTVLTVDPAISEKREGDFTAMAVTGIDQFSNIFIKDLARGHWKPSQIIEAIFYLDELWHPNAILVETIAYQKALAYFLQDEMRRRNKYLPIIEKKFQEKSKRERILSLQPVYQNKKVFHRKELKMNAYLEEELVKFPRFKRDDLADTLSMALEYLTPPKGKRERYHQHYLY